MCNQNQQIHPNFFKKLIAPEYASLHSVPLGAIALI